MEIQSIVQKEKGKTRKGKGFSRGELKEVGTDFKQALRLGIPIDLRRKTKHKENIKILKGHLHKLKSDIEGSKSVRVKRIKQKE